MMRRHLLLHALPVLLIGCGTAQHAATSEPLPPPAGAPGLMEAMRRASTAHGGLVWEAALDGANGRAWVELLSGSTSRRITVGPGGRVSAEAPEPITADEAAEARLVQDARTTALEGAAAAEAATGGRAVKVEVDEEDHAWEVRVIVNGGLATVRVDMGSGRVTRAGG
ncbi:hypothetical protein GWK16_03250 [Roseomonas sp. JC162]|uniref:PepSY domain-containing protein n=1 Tax=Neoroseomonas marina TaxID=1232220 RepID=A0A848E9U8_9PROT|nr:PepSY domain-containing protein [Neoroseomonas marina]NMJ40240.1 hypothetical protein [Neoroseomonas marina]